MVSASMTYPYHSSISIFDALNLLRCDSHEHVRRRLNHLHAEHLNIADIQNFRLDDAALALELAVVILQKSILYGRY